VRLGARRIAGAALLAVGIAVALVIVTSDDRDTERLDVVLASANGLREGTVVKVGGAQVGTIDELRITRGDDVVAELALDQDKAPPITAGASARVVASNLLGSKYIDLAPGRRGATRLRSLPAARVTSPVDLDQVLNVLDMDTRARLRVLINEAGLALTGRATDFNVVLRQLPRDFDGARRLIDELTSDNRTLGEAVAHSSRFMSEIATQRRELGRLVDTARDTVTSVAARRAALRAALAKAPRTLRTARQFFDELRRTAAPLRPAARAITATAPSLSAALSELPAFRRAARPTLREARSAAPLLTRLGAEATPVARQAIPALEQTAQFARTAPPLTRALDVSVDDVLGLMEGWARSIQDADALGHIFRGKAMASADAIRTILDQDVPARRDQNKRKNQGGAPSPASTPGAEQPGAPPKRPAPALRLPEIKLPGLPPINLPALIPEQPQSNKDAGIDTLLDYLIGP